jgi:hypothetical protein
MLDDHDLVRLNDGSLTRVVAPPNKSTAIDLTLRSSDLSLGRRSWMVLDDAAGIVIVSRSLLHFKL